MRGNGRPAVSVNPLTEASLERLRRALRPGPALILTHDNPDPDALAAGTGLAYLLEEKWGLATHKVFSGSVARAENVAMMHRLTPGWQAINCLDEAPAYSNLILVDSQPGAGNNLLSNGTAPTAVFDHHEPFRPLSERAAYLDLRPEMGATATMVYQYLEAADLPVPRELATALYYGIKTDTRGLSRGKTAEDEVAYLSLLVDVDRDLLFQVEHATRPAIFFKGLMEGLAAARVHKSAVVSVLGEMHRSDFAAELADQLITLEGTRGAVCLGTHQGVLHLSVRTVRLGADAGFLVQGLIAGLGSGGGHGTIAGGQVALDGREAGPVAAVIVNRFLEMMGEGETAGVLLVA